MVGPDPWSEFASAVTRAGRGVVDDAGHEHVVRQVIARLEAVLADRDVNHPALRRTTDAFRKIGGDNPDAIYASCAIDGGTSYRIFGSRGNAVVVTVTLTRGASAFLDGRPGVVANHILTDDDVDLTLDDLPEDTAMVMVRQFFGDWTSSMPAVLCIERVGPPVAPRRAGVAEIIGDAGGAVERGVARFRSLWEGLQTRRNELVPVTDQAERTATPGGIAMAGMWDVPVGQAAVIEFDDPRSAYWNVQVGTMWHSSIDYRIHRASANNAQTPVDRDGVIRLVLAHEDPGYVNWLATGGYECGVMGMRVWGAATAPVVRITTVAAEALELPGVRCTQRERAAELRARRIAVDRRFRA